MRSLSHREVDALVELADERPQDGRGGGEQACVAGPSGERVDAPAEPIGEALGVALDVPVLGEGLQRPRELALVVPAQLCEPHHAEAACPSARRRGARAPRARGQALPFPGSRLHCPVRLHEDATRCECRNRAARVFRPTSVVSATRSLGRKTSSSSSSGLWSRWTRRPTRSASRRGRRRELQELLAERLRACGADVRVWEPEPGARRRAPDGSRRVHVRRATAARRPLSRVGRRAHPAAQRSHRRRVGRPRRALVASSARRGGRGRPSFTAAGRAT